MLINLPVLTVYDQSKVLIAFITRFKCAVHNAVENIKDVTIFSTKLINY